MSSSHRTLPGPQIWNFAEILFGSLNSELLRGSFTIGKQIDMPANVHTLDLLSSLPIYSFAIII
jgi:hypothetical protein